MKIRIIADKVSVVMGIVSLLCFGVNAVCRIILSLTQPKHMGFGKERT